MSDVFEVAWSVVKGSPVPEWARPKGANRRDVMFEGSNLTDKFRDFGGDITDYGRGFNQMRVERENELDNEVDENLFAVGDVKDFATGTYGDTNAFVGGQSGGYYGNVPTDTRVIDGSSGKNEQGETVYNVVGEKPTGGRTSTMGGNKFLPSKGGMPMGSLMPNPDYNMPIQETSKYKQYHQHQQNNQNLAAKLQRLS